MDMDIVDMMQRTGSCLLYRPAPWGGGGGGAGGARHPGPPQPRGAGQAPAPDVMGGGRCWFAVGLGVATAQRVGGGGAWSCDGRKRDCCTCDGDGCTGVCVRRSQSLLLSSRVRLSAAPISVDTFHSPVAEAAPGPPHPPPTPPRSRSAYSESVTQFSGGFCHRNAVATVQPAGGVRIPAAFWSGSVLGFSAATSVVWCSRIRAGVQGPMGRTRTGGLCTPNATPDGLWGTTPLTAGAGGDTWKEWTGSLEITTKNYDRKMYAHGG